MRRRAPAVSRSPRPMTPAAVSRRMELSKHSAQRVAAQLALRNEGGRAAIGDDRAEVRLVMARGENDLRTDAVLAQELLGDRKPVHVRKLDVEQDEVRVQPLSGLEPGAAVDSLSDDLEPVGHEEGPDRRAKARVVV